MAICTVSHIARLFKLGWLKKTYKFFYVQFEKIIALSAIAIKINQLESNQIQIYKTHWFDNWAKKQNLSSQALCQAVQEMKNGLYDADLGGGLFKKRIAKPEHGKSGGFRTLIATNKGSRWFFVFGFEKNARNNINQKSKPL